MSATPKTTPIVQSTSTSVAAFPSVSSGRVVDGLKQSHWYNYVHDYHCKNFYIEVAYYVGGGKHGTGDLTPHYHQDMHGKHYASLVHI